MPSTCLPTSLPRAQRARRLACLLAFMAAGLAGCGSGPPRSPGPPPGQGAGAGPGPGAAPTDPQAAPTLGNEPRWLHQWFDGTPLRLTDRDDGALLLEVPLEHAFDAQTAAPRPALRAVLDKLAQSLQRLPMAQLQLAAPAPAAPARLAAMRAHLGAQGIGPSRLPAGAAGRPGWVALTLAPRARR